MVQRNGEQFPWGMCEKMKLMENIMRIDKSSYVSFRLIQHNFMTTGTAVEEITLSELTKEYLMCLVDCILRGTDPRKYFTGNIRIYFIMALGNLRTSNYSEQTLKSTFVPKMIGIRSKGHGEGILIIKHRKLNDYYATWSNTVSGFLKNESNF